MLLPLSVLIAFLVGICWFGNIGGFLTVEVKLLWLPAASVLAELSLLPLSMLFGDGFSPWAFIPTSASYALLLAFFLFNLRLRGTVLMALGSGANFAVIAANGFRMPVAAVPESGMTEFQSLRYALMSSDTRLAFLGDILWVPLPFMRGYASWGDLLLAAGAAVFILYIMRPDGGYFSKKHSFRRI